MVEMPRFELGSKRVIDKVLMRVVLVMSRMNRKATKIQTLKPQWNFEHVHGARTVLYARWVGTADSLSSIKRAMAQVIRRERVRVKD